MSAPRYVVDGYEFENEGGTLQGDGQHPPFLVFDPETQDYVGVPHSTRGAAQVVADLLNGTTSPQVLS